MSRIKTYYHDEICQGINHAQIRKDELTDQHYRIYLQSLFKKVDGVVALLKCRTIIAPYLISNNIDVAFEDFIVIATSDNPDELKHLCTLLNFDYKYDYTDKSIGGKE